MIYQLRHETGTTLITTAVTVEQAATHFARGQYAPGVTVRRQTGRPRRAGYFQAVRETSGRPVAVGTRFHVAFHEPT